MQELINKHYRQHNGNKLFFARAFIAEVNKKDNEWFLDQLNNLNEVQRKNGYETLKGKTAQITLTLKEKGDRFEHIDEMILNKSNIGEFMSVALHFFKKDQPKLSDDLIWQMNLNSNVNYWLKFHFLIGALREDIEKNGYKVVYEIQEQKMTPIKCLN